MFTIQYEAVDGSHMMQEVDTNQRRKLLLVLATFTRPIEAVYEQTSPITKTMRKELASYLGTKSTYANEFANSQASG